MKSTIRVSKVYDLPYIAENSTHSYIDLRLDPDRIKLIPELVSQPVLRELVATLNGKHGPFMTHGCAFAQRPPNEPGGTIPLSPESRGATHWCTSYVIFSYWLMGLNREENYAALYEGYQQEAHGTEVCFVIQPAYFRTLYEERVDAKWSDTNAAVCLVWVSGWGASEASAQSRWRNTVKGLTAFFSGVKVSADEGSGITVSEHMRSDSPLPPPGWQP
jgi:hypothetical protein